MHSNSFKNSTGASAGNPEPRDAGDRRKVVIAGGSGFLGRGLADRLIARGDLVVVLSRRSAPSDLPQQVSWRRWDGKTMGAWAQDLDGADAVVNFVGRSVDCRKTEANKREIFASRLDSVRVLGEALRQRADTGSPLPGVWIQSGTAHIYGDPLPEDTVLEDGGPVGQGLAPEVGIAWEKEFHENKPAGQRGIVLRTSFVLGRNGGALQTMARLARLGLGGRIGSGKQWISWIHEEDFHRLVMQMIDDTAFNGVYNVTSPNPVTNKQFMQALRKASRRPWSPPAPALRFASRWVMNTDPELALLGRRVLPSRLAAQTGFVFQWPRIQASLADLL